MIVGFVRMGVITQLMIKLVSVNVMTNFTKDQECKVKLPDTNTCKLPSGFIIRIKKTKNGWEAI